MAGTQALSQDASYANVSVLSDAGANFRAPQKLDLLWTAQNYHDLHDSFMGPAGVRDTETLHRIDPQRLRAEIEAAGFVLEAQSDLLRNPQDDHSLSVFDGRVRGRTDQVIYRFRKPK